MPWASRSNWQQQQIARAQSLSLVASQRAPIWKKRRGERAGASRSFVVGVSDRRGERAEKKDLSVSRAFAIIRSVPIFSKLALEGEEQKGDLKASVLLVFKSVMLKKKLKLFLLS